MKHDQRPSEPVDHCVQMFVIDRRGRPELHMLATREGLTVLHRLFTSLAEGSPARVDVASFPRIERIAPLELSLELVHVDENAGWLRRTLFSPRQGLHQDDPRRPRLCWRLERETWLELADKVAGFLDGCPGGFNYLDNGYNDDVQAILGHVDVIPDQRGGIRRLAD